MTKSRIALSKINCSPSGTRQNPTRHRLTKIGSTMSQEEHPATSTWRNRGLRNDNNNHIAVRVKVKSSRSEIFFPPKISESVGNAICGRDLAADCAEPRNIESAYLVRESLNLRYPGVRTIHETAPAARV
jgi:hypothetical protein